MQEGKCCCSKEPVGSIPIARIIDKIDAMFAKNDMDGAGKVLKYWEAEARALCDDKGLCEILSEEIGYFRKIGDEKSGLKAVYETLDLLETMCQDSVSNATVYLNCATTLKAFGRAKEALPYYEKARKVFESALEKDDFRLAGLYNNYATALVDLKRFDEAQLFYEKAINLLLGKGSCAEVAVSYVNFAHLVYERAQETGEQADDKVEELLFKAYEYLDDVNLKRDGNYAYICEKCADSFGYFGYFLQKADLEKRANEIYASN